MRQSARVGRRPGEYPPGRGESMNRQTRVRPDARAFRPFARPARPILVWLSVAAGLACASVAPPLQRVAVHLEPQDAAMWVDGTRVAEGTRAVQLRSDTPHVVLVRRDGYRPQQVVLEPQGAGEAMRLEPTEIRLELEPLVPTERAIRIQGSE